MPDLRRIALTLLARREHSSAELGRKLRQRAADEAEIEALIETLVREGWLDDRRFAESFVRYRIAKGFGPLRIDGELRERGITSSLARSLVWESGEPWEQRAETARRKRFGDGPPHDRERRAKQSRFLEHRGFTREQISRILWRSQHNGKVHD